MHDAADRPLSNIAIDVRSATPPLERIRAFTEPDGSLVVSDLREADYTVTVASAILSPPRSVRMQNTAPVTLSVRLPITILIAPGHPSDVVSVQQLSVPPKLQTTMQRALDAWSQKDLRRSRALALAALQLRAEYPPALTLLGMIDLADGKPDEAISQLLQALRQVPSSESAYLTLASAYNHQGQHTAALDALSLMSKLVPENWQLHYETGRAYVGQARFEDAMQELERAQQLSTDDNLVVHLAKARALTGMRNYDGARNELASVQRKSPHGIFSDESQRLAEYINSVAHTPAVGSGIPTTASVRIAH